MCVYVVCVCVCVSVSRLSVLTVDWYEEVSLCKGVLILSADVGE